MTLVTAILIPLIQSPRFVALCSGAKKGSVHQKWINEVLLKPTSTQSPWQDDGSLILKTDSGLRIMVAPDARLTAPLRLKREFLSIYREHPALKSLTISQFSESGGKYLERLLGLQFPAYEVTGNTKLAIFNGLTIRTTFPATQRFQLSVNRRASESYRQSTAGAGKLPGEKGASSALDKEIGDLLSNGSLLKKRNAAEAKQYLEDLRDSEVFDQWITSASLSRVTESSSIGEAASFLSAQLRQLGKSLDDEIVQLELKLDPKNSKFINLLNCRTYADYRAFEPDDYKQELQDVTRNWASKGYRSATEAREKFDSVPFSTSIEFGIFFQLDGERRYRILSLLDGG